jgi:UDP-N-acetyl-D-mannosaminuronate dehydrogenase
LINSAAACVAEADVLVVTTAWQEFASIPVDAFGTGGQRKTIIDCWRILDEESISEVADYVPLGQGGVHAPLQQN